jgi:hypothetical protein
MIALSLIHLAKHYIYDIIKIENQKKHLTSFWVTFMHDMSAFNDARFEVFINTAWVYFRWFSSSHIHMKWRKRGDL